MLTIRSSLQPETYPTEERFQSLVESIDGVVWEASITPLAFTYISPKLQTMFGFAIVDWLGSIESWIAAIHPEDRDEAVSYCSIETDAGRDHSFRYRLQTPNRGTLWVQDIVTLVRHDGRTVGLRGIFVDITAQVRAVQALKDSEAHYRAIVQFQQELICRWLPDGTLTFVNDAYCHFYGRSRDELLGSSFYHLIPEDARLVLQEEIAASLATLTPAAPIMNYVHLSYNAAGKHCWHEWIDQAIFDDAGQLMEIQSVGRDISDRKHAEAELKRQQQFYSTLAEGVGGIIWEIDFAALAFTYMSPQLKTFLGIDPSEWLGPIDTWLAAIHPDDRQKTLDYCMSEVLAGKDFSCEYRVVTPSRGTVWLRAIGSVVLLEGQPVIVRGVTIDISAQRTQQQLLQKSNRQLRKFSLHHEQILEEERQQIARHLHDELGQSLTAINFDIAWLKKRSADQAILARLDDMANQIRQTTQTVQTICSTLRPSLLNDLGLAAAMEWHLAEFTRRTGIRGTITESRFNESEVQLAGHFYRIFLEALTNVIRHAQATEVTVALGKKARNWFLEIADNGCGITAGAIRRTSSFGLLGIRERAALLGGTARISRRSEGGTIVRVTAPGNQAQKRTPSCTP